MLDLADRAWPLLGRLADLHVAVYRLSGGRIGHRVPGMARMLLLEHTGARSGVRRTTPLVYAKDGPNLVVVASKGGHPRHPAWYHNLVANPDVAVQVGTERRTVRARVAGADERARLWALALTAYSGYDEYQRRTDREIPLVVLEPRRA
ncbi:MAG TPA: nitroreductase family deazaflavin-dependent oxidoreductase [Pseudonocardia sp.]|jgi:deazaflavin-dependent oxidoreductase (nitroreductase family)|nr:nitroreductase family deazaflavin-dependent oxidoreductase [Pseudonocardia sp.]